MLKPVWVVFALAAVAAPFSSAQTTGAEVAKPSFTVFHEFGRIEEASYNNVTTIENQWVHRSGAWINLKARRDERLGVDLLFGGVYYTATKEESDLNTKTRFFSASVPRLDVSYLVGDVEDPFLKVNAGIFNYKYNEYARNLGEYAFRTGTYPGWITTGGITYAGVNSAQVTGLKLGQSFGAFSHDLLLNLETEVIPTYDLTATYMAKYNWNNILKVGGGVQFARLLPAVPSKTNPNRIPDPFHPSGYNPNVSNRYFKYNGEYYLDWSEYYELRMKHKTTTAADSLKYQKTLAILDSARGRTTSDVPLDGGAGLPLISVEYESFKASGVKPIAHFAFDPKPLLGLDVFGASDLVLYGEAALLGLKDYPILYDDWKRRIPVMLGFNLPAFRLLDVLAVEVEYYGSRFPDNYHMLMEGGVKGFPWPTITEGNAGYSPEDWKKDDWKWSVFTQRRLVDGVFLSGQIARDHARGWEYPRGKTFWGMMQEKGDWYWMLKLTANI